jgi:integrase
MASTPLPHTFGHENCPACDAELYEAMRAANSAELPFSEAARLWLLTSREEVADQTHKDRELFIGRLNKFFGPMILNKIHIGNIRQYQKARQGKADNPADNLGEAGAELINHEISALARILDAAGLWKPIKLHYKCLKVPKYGPGRALEATERERLVMCAASNPRWKVAYLCTLLTLNLTRGAGEVRKVKIKDVDLRSRNLSIEEGAKNAYRVVDFPMNDTVHWCCGQLLKRYYRLCEKYGVTPSPDHYLLPARIKHGDGYDFNKPQRGWRSAWNSLSKRRS